jgi:hypothetical protein
LKRREAAKLFGIIFSRRKTYEVLISTKYTFWAIFSQSHLVTLDVSKNKFKSPSPCNLPNKTLGFGAFISPARLSLLISVNLAAIMFSGRVARFFLVQHTKTWKNVPNYRKIYPKSIKYSNFP